MMKSTVMHAKSIELGKPIELDSSLQHLTFSAATYSNPEMKAGNLTLQVQGFILHRPYPQIDSEKDGTKILEAELVFSGVAHSSRIILPIKEDWQSRQGPDRFEPVQSIEDCPTADLTGKKKFDMGPGGYFLKAGQHCEIQEWIVYADSLILIPKSVQK